MSAHDPLCPQYLDGFRERCVCDRLSQIRADERRTVEKRVRESGVARWLPSHAWDLLIGCVRGGVR